ncbi:MAG: S-layer homology domain-containing protein [Chloroflexi bacterium]|nr:S-layer homology domain-containing protein [Chloroflexota bacterium]
MKHKNLILIGTVLASLLIALSFGVQKAHATTGCFTDTIGHPFETFICWMLDNGITSGTSPGIYSPNANVTRGQMAVFMQRQAEIPPTTGNIYINAGLNDWIPNGTSGASINYYTNVIELHAPSAGTYGFQITPDLPGTLYNRQMYFHSVKLCYDATHGASIVGVYLRHYEGGATPTIFNEVTDFTARTDAICRIYSFTGDGSLWGSDHVVLFIQGSFGSSANSIWIGATTFTLVPSAITGTLSPTDSTEQRPVMEVPQPVNTGENGQ